jgi:hypothetical protein
MVSNGLSAWIGLGAMLRKSLPETAMVQVKPFVKHNVADDQF